MPLALSLAVGGLLYAAYQGNKRLVDGVASRPSLVSQDARGALPSTATRAPAAPPDSANASVPTRTTESLVESAEGDDLDLSRLDERCTAIAAAALAAAEAIDANVPREEFVRRPAIAFVNDPALRAELERMAERLYDSPPATPAMAQRDALGEARCL